MGVEIEHKFLVTSDEWRNGAVGVPYVQGYIAHERGNVTRVRLAGDQGYVTIKGPRDSTGLGRAEYEYPIPAADAREMLDNLCQDSLVEKTRYKIPYGGLVWEVDEFKGANAGLIVAEVEVPSADYPVELPPWVGAEVSQDSRYSNGTLSKKPYSQWNQDTKQCHTPKP